MENEKAGIHQVLTSWLQGERKIREKVVLFELAIRFNGQRRALE